MVKITFQTERRCQASNNWCQSLFSWSPWLTILLMVMVGPLILWLLALRIGLCLFNSILGYVKQRINSVKLLVLRR